MPFASVCTRALRSRRVRVAPVWFVVVAAITASPAHALTIVTYNLLNYNSDATRHPHYKTILNMIEPDVLLVQEILSQTAVNNFLNLVLNAADGPGGYAAAPFVNGPDTDGAMFYRTAILAYDSNDPTSFAVIPTTLRNIYRWKLRPNGYSSPQAEIYLYTMHLKASSGSDNEQRRLEEVTILRENAAALPPGSNFVYTGDFNIYFSGEPAYLKMTGIEENNNGRAFDPIATPGNWHDGAQFALIHTQSPRTTSFGGGATGGMDDRFDQILVSAALNDDQGFSYVPGTYYAFGNDGLHFNNSIVATPVIPEGSTVANAIHQASDHLPVVAGFQVPAVLEADATIDFGTVIVGADAVAPLSIRNAADLLTFTYADTMDYTLVAPVGFTVDGGPFAAGAGQGANLHDVTMLTGTAGPKSGDLAIDSDAPDAALAVVALSGAVLDHARPSTTAADELPDATLDFGTQPPGAFPVLQALVANYNHNEFQAQLEVYDAEITGPDAARFSIVGGFSPSLVGDSPVAFDVALDDSGLGAGVALSATLTLRTRDQQDLPGAAALGDLTYTLLAQTGGAGVPGDLDGDGDVDLLDFASFTICVGGPDVTTPPPGCNTQTFADADLDGDGDVDLVDFSTFSAHFGA